MKDIYLYDDVPVLKNKLNIKDKDELDNAEADYVSYRLKSLAIQPMKGAYDYRHFLAMHEYVFQDIYEWAGVQRKVNIYKEEPVLGGMSVEYAEVFDIAKEATEAIDSMTSKKWHEMDIETKAEEFCESLAAIWRVHCFREGNTRIAVTFACQYADEFICNINRKLFEDNSTYLRTALVAYNAYFKDGSDFRKKEYLYKIVLDAMDGR